MRPKREDVHTTRLQTEFLESLARRTCHARGPVPPSLRNDNFNHSDVRQICTLEVTHRIKSVEQPNITAGHGRNNDKLIFVLSNLRYRAFQRILWEPAFDNERIGRYWRVDCEERMQESCDPDRNGQHREPHKAPSGQTSMAPIYDGTRSFHHRSAFHPNSSVQNAPHRLRGREAASYSSHPVGAAAEPGSSTSASTAFEYTRRHLSAKARQDLVVTCLLG